MISERPSSGFQNRTDFIHFDKSHLARIITMLRNIAATHILNTYEASFCPYPMLKLNGRPQTRYQTRGFLSVRHMVFARI